MFRITLRTVQSLVFLLLAGMSLGAYAATSESLLIGPGDSLHITVVDTPELEQHPRVTDAGEIPLTGVGSLKVAGLTPAQAADAIRERLISAGYMNHPTVSVVVDQYATQTVSVLGQVKTPGAYPIGTSRSVLDVVALAGGLNDVADRHIMIERHDGTTKPVSYNLSNDASEAIAQQVRVYPGDTVVVPKAGIAYVLGDVARPGGLVMQNNHSQLTALQAVSLAGGTAHSAVPAHAKLIRRLSQGGFQEIPVNFSNIQKGKAPDFPLEADDVLYIPFSYLRNIAGNASGIAASTAGAAVYSVP